MPLTEHLREFRSRTLLSVLGLLAGAVGGWFLFDPVFNGLAQPILDLQEQGLNATLNFTTVAAAFDMKMRIALFIGALIGVSTSSYNKSKDEDGKGDSDVSQ